MTFPRTRLKKYFWGDQEFRLLSPKDPFGLGVHGALAVKNFGSGLRVKGEDEQVSNDLCNAVGQWLKREMALLRFTRSE